MKNLILILGVVFTSLTSLAEDSKTSFAELMFKKSCATNDFDTCEASIKDLIVSQMSLSEISSLIDSVTSSLEPGEKEARKEQLNKIADDFYNFKFNQNSGQALFGNTEDTDDLLPDRVLEEMSSQKVN